MAKNKNRNRDDDAPDVYFIPPNYVDSSGVFGGMFRLRNAIEACAIGGISAWLLFGVTAGMDLTMRVTILLAVVLPLMFFAAIGVMGLSVTEFLHFCFRFVFKRRIIGRSAFNAVSEDEAVYEAQWNGKEGTVKRRVRRTGLFARKIKRRIDAGIDPGKRQKGMLVRGRGKGRWGKFIRTSNEVADYIPIKKIKNGIIYTTDGRYVKMIEVTPINFLLRTPKEQRSIIWSFVSFLKISPVKMQLKCLSKKADIEKHLSAAKADLDRETNEECRILQEDYMKLLYDIGSKEAVSRRFFIIFEYEPYMRAKDIEADAIAKAEVSINLRKSTFIYIYNSIFWRKLQHVLHNLQKKLHAKYQNAT